MNIIYIKAYNTYAKYAMFIHVLLVHKLITLQKQSSVFCKKNVLNVCNVLSALGVGDVYFS